MTRARAIAPGALHHNLCKVQAQWHYCRQLRPVFPAGSTIFLGFQQVFHKIALVSPCFRLPLGGNQEQSAVHLERLYPGVRLEHPGNQAMQAGWRRDSASADNQGSVAPSGRSQDGPLQPGSGRTLESGDASTQYRLAGTSFAEAACSTALGRAQEVDRSRPCGLRRQRLPAWWRRHSMTTVP